MSGVISQFLAGVQSFDRVVEPLFSGMKLTLLKLKPTLYSLKPDRGLAQAPRPISKKLARSEYKFGKVLALSDTFLVRNTDQPIIKIVPIDLQFQFNY